jgi:hypothetical protein
MLIIQTVYTKLDVEYKYEHFKKQKKLGKTIIKNLSLVGVNIFKELQESGSFKVYLKLVSKFQNKT